MLVNHYLRTEATGIGAPLVVFSVLAFVALNRTRTHLEQQSLALDAQARMLERIGPALCGVTVASLTVGSPAPRPCSRCGARRLRRSALPPPG